MTGKLRIPVLLVALLSCCYISRGQSVELFAGDDNLQADIQWLKPFTAESRFLFFNRNRFTVDYSNKTNYFISGITAYEFTNSGLGIASEINVTTGGVLPKLGLQFLAASPERTLYAFVNVGYLKEWLYGLFCFARLEPRLSEKVRLYLQLEVVNSTSRAGNQFFAQRPRIGMGINRTQFGFAGDFTQAGKDFQYASNLGVFLRKGF